MIVDERAGWGDTLGVGARVCIDVYGEVNMSKMESVWRLM